MVKGLREYFPMIRTRDEILQEIRQDENLDIFRDKLYNRGIETPLDAWLAFLSVDDPEWIGRLIQQYPEFIPLYEEVYVICKNVEKVMGIFSEELKILDRNTVQLMIDKLHPLCRML